jgi:hypothetical protein
MLIHSYFSSWHILANTTYYFWDLCRLLRPSQIEHICYFQCFTAVNVKKVHITFGEEHNCHCQVFFGIYKAGFAALD